MKGLELSQGTCCHRTSLLWIFKAYLEVSPGHCAHLVYMVFLIRFTRKREGAALSADIQLHLVHIL